MEICPEMLEAIDRFFNAPIEPTESDPRDQSFIYIVAYRNKDAFTGPVKVGISNNPEKRVASFKTGNPGGIELYHKFWIPDLDRAKYAEKAFHTVFNKYKIKGEWFSLDPEQAFNGMCSNIHALLENWDVTGGDQKLFAAISIFVEGGGYGGGGRSNEF